MSNKVTLLSAKNTLAAFTDDSIGFTLQQIEAMELAKSMIDKLPEDDSVISDFLELEDDEQDAVLYIQTALGNHHNRFRESLSDDAKQRRNVWLDMQPK